MAVMLNTAASADGIPFIPHTFFPFTLYYQTLALEELEGLLWHACCDLTYLQNMSTLYQRLTSPCSAMYGKSVWRCTIVAIVCLSRWRLISDTCIRTCSPCPGQKLNCHLRKEQWNSCNRHLKRQSPSRPGA